MQRNTHFDDNRIIWRDEYSGQYDVPPLGYSEEFDLQWRLGLEGKDGYYRHPGACVDDDYIADRVYEWTGHHPLGVEHYDASCGARPLDHPIDVFLIKGKECADIGCGMGRWTRTLQKIGAASVLSVDMSESALQSVRRYNDRVMKANIMTLIREYPELKEQFDFTVFWGVAMCTHDPLQAFLNAAATVKPGGTLYMMVYAPEGMHGASITKYQRRKFHRLRTVSERLAMVDNIFNRRWDSDYPFIENVKNLWRNMRRLPKGSKLGLLDALEPFYNWVIPLEVIEGWMAKGNFSNMKLLNERENPKCAYHVLAIKG
ncbi:MAG: class I SAM-dependent methyltransferase [Acidiferrobacterales bacterium]